LLGKRVFKGNPNKINGLASILGKTLFFDGAFAPAVSNLFMLNMSNFRLSAPKLGALLLYNAAPFNLIINLGIQ
jgi:hypothetical protein